MREEKAQERYGGHKSPRSSLGRRRKQREEDSKSKLLLGFGVETRWTRQWREGRGSGGRGGTYLGDRRRTGTRTVGADGEGGVHACMGAGRRRTVERGESARACCSGAAPHAVRSGRTG